MSQRNFQLRLNCAYTDPNNTIDSLDVEILEDGSWKPFDLNTSTGGFDIFMYSIFTCQHTYFRINAAECDLGLKTSKGIITIGADDDWKLDMLHIDFNAQLADGVPTQDNIDYITQRMTLCPVSKNIHTVADSNTIVTFDHS